MRLDWVETASQPWPRIAGVLFNDRLSRDGNLPACPPSLPPLYYVSLPPTLFTTAAGSVNCLVAADISLPLNLPLRASLDEKTETALQRARSPRFDERRPRIMVAHFTVTLLYHRPSCMQKDGDGWKISV